MHNRINRSVIGLGLCMVGILSTVIWALPRGLDLTDESFYFIHIYYPNRYATLYGFGVIYHQLFSAFTYDVLDLRYAKLGQGIAEATIFGLTFVHFFYKQADFKNKAIIFLALFCVNFVGFSLFLPTVSYNDLNNFLTALATACLLLSFSFLAKENAASSRIPPYFWLLGSGFFTGFNFFNKASASLALTLLIWLVLVYFYGRDGRKLFRCWVVWTGGYGLALIGYFWFFQPFSEWSASYSEGLRGKGQQFSLLALLGWYAYFLARIGLFLAAIVAPWVLLYARWFRKLRAQLSPRYRSLLTVGSMIWSTGFILGSKLIWGGKAAFGKLSLVYLLIILAQLIWLDARLQARQTAWKTAWQHHRTTWIWLLFFFLVPFACCIGSGNSLTRQAAFHVLFWGASILLLNQILRAQDHRADLVPLGLGLLVTFQILTGTRDPYSASVLIEKPVTLFEQTTFPTDLYGLGRIRLDPQSRQAYQQINQLVNQYRNRIANQAIFYDLPGLNFITQTVSPGTEWYFHGYDEFLCYSLSQTGFSSQKFPLIAYLDKRRPSETAQRCFREKQWLVTGQYHRVASIYLASQRDTLHVFVPK
ncbi:MAG: hypothetical protein LH606_02350 [Cytophagaceae bacterium]|nr:hypothetical protein [Cytophagaceae bacterium]